MLKRRLFSPQISRKTQLEVSDEKDEELQALYQKNPWVLKHCFGRDEAGVGGKEEF